MDAIGIFKELTERYPCLEEISDNIFTAYEMLCDCYDNFGKVLICGNGGSSADSDHIVGELMKGFLLQRPIEEDECELFAEYEDAEYLVKHLQGSLPAISLSSQTALNTAFCNDIAPDMVFAQQVFGYSKNSPDILIALSTSGNSKNIVNAVKVANAIGIDSIGITGSADSKMSELCTVCLRLPETETFKVQELTLPVYHALCAAVEAYFFI